MSAGQPRPAARDTDSAALRSKLYTDTLLGETGGAGDVLLKRLLDTAGGLA